MKKYIVGFALLFVMIQLSYGQTASLKNKMKNLIEDNFVFAAKQYQYLKANTPDSLMPRSYVPATGKSVTSDTKWWCSGFYPGTLWYLYAHTKDENIRKEAEKRLGILEKEKYYTGNHDLGFMIYCSFGTAYKYTNNPAYKDVVAIAAKSLSTRYRPTIKSIQSWNSSARLSCPVIIDNMMNLELLFWASRETGDQRFHDIAITHADNTIKNHFRPDYSSHHVICYDPDGKVLAKKQHQGYQDESTWTRGHAWAIYGYVAMYRETKDKKYLDFAQKITDFYLNHPNLPKDKIPYWDFNAPNIPNEERDASAGAITASALLELSKYSGAKGKRYFNDAVTMMESLSSPAYRAALGENNNFLIKHCVGAKGLNSEIDVPLIYADYYYLEALLRLQNYKQKK